MKKIRPKAELLWFGTVDEGKKLVINSVFDNVSWDLVTISADDQDESLWFEIEVDGKIIQIPLDQIKEAIDAALGEVHSESWYEKNVYPDEST